MNPVGPLPIGGNHRKRCERHAQRKRAPAQPVMAVGTLDDGGHDLRSGAGLESAHPRFDGGRV